MNKYEKKVYSQNGEDGIIEEIFNRIGTTNKFFVEFGVSDGIECNTRLLRQKGWNGICMDSIFKNEVIHRVFMTAENINDVFASFDVPKHFDLLSVDVDGNDFWLWQNLVGYRPRCVVIEYNSRLPPNKFLVLPYDSNFTYKNDGIFGASLSALIELGKRKGYEYICVNSALESKYVNAFFVESEYISYFANEKIIIPKKKYNRDNYSGKVMKNIISHMINPFESSKSKFNNNNNKQGESL